MKSEAETSVKDIKVCTLKSEHFFFFLENYLSPTPAFVNPKVHFKALAIPKPVITLKRLRYIFSEWGSMDMLT